MEDFRVVFEVIPGYSSSTTSSSTSRESASLADISEGNSSGSTASKTRKRPIPRKGHTKSRKGCLNCKKRKIKCQETLPECNHCTRIGSRCEYSTDQQSKQVVHLTRSPSPSANLQATPTTFSMDDLRFFQHFLLKAYPPLPLQGGEIWKDVAQISHSFDYLIHSMLGLAASSLSLSHCPTNPDSSPYSSSALSHRVTAIRLLNTSLSKPCSSPEEGTARYATMMVLTFQSSYLPDGVLEFIAMTRGCHVVAETAMGRPFVSSPFGGFSREGHVRAVRMLGQEEDRGTELNGRGVLDEEVAIGFLKALGHVECLTFGHGLMEELRTKLVKAVLLAREDCVEAFNEITTVYALLSAASQKEFSQLVDPASYNLRPEILLIYFVLIEFAVARYAMGVGTVNSPFAYRTAMNKLWLENLLSKIPKDAYDYWEEYLRWPIEFVKSLEI